MLRKNFIWNLIGSVLYACTSLVFLIIATRINGADDAGLFAFAFANATVFQVIGTYASRSYQVTEQDRKITDNDYIHHRILAVLLMIILGIGYGLIRGSTGLKLALIIILIIYKAIDAFSDTLYGIIQKHDRLYQVGISFCLKGIIGSAVFLVANLITRNLIISSLGLVLTSFLTMVLYDFPMAKKCGYKLRKINWAGSLKLFRLGFFAFVFYFLTQYLINAPKYAIDQALAPDAQTIYGIIAMPASVMIVAANFITAPFLTQVKKYLSQKQYHQVNLLALKISLAIVALGATGILLGFLLGVPVFRLLYGIDISAYLGGLTLVILGATIFAVTVVLSNILVAMRRTISQAAIFIITSIGTWLLARCLVAEQGIMGGAWAYCASMSILLVLYLIVYFYAAKQLTQQRVRP